MFSALALAAMLTSQAARQTVRPKPDPPVYVTPNCALTFRASPKLTYCPMPKGWVGSDHGTTLFLVPPRQCGGAGYPSSSRGFLPPDTSRIEVYYGYSFDEVPDRPCNAGGRFRFLGRMQTLCRDKAGRSFTLEVRGRYEADQPAEASVRLVTSSDRLSRDTEILVGLANSMRACRVLGASPSLGTGAACPNAPWY
jgi:hypothetical protein